MSSQLKKILFVCTYFIVFISAFCVSNLRAAELVTIPLTLDEQLLTALLVDSAFTGKGRSAEVIGQEGDCIYVKLENPKYSIENNLLKLEMALSVHGGTEMGGKCLFPLTWQGFLVLWQDPVFVGDELSLSFKIKIQRS